MKPYPRYKPTGLAWLPSVPDHWEVTKIRSLFTERTTKVSDKDYPPLSVTKDGVVPQMENVAKSDDGDNRKLVRNGDFVINSRSDRKGSSGISSLDGSVSLVNLVLKPRTDGNRGFFHYLLKSNSFVEEFYRNGHGIVADLWTTRYSEMKSIYLPLPPPSEQARIVAYLDEKTAAIDELVRAKEREIDLLRERKQALVSAAVTGREEAGREGQERREGRAALGTPGTSGTPVPNVPFVPDPSSPSGPSRPASPAGWRACRLKELIRCFKGLNITKADLVQEGAAVISYGQIHAKDNDGLSLKDSHLRFVSPERAEPSAKLRRGDSVFADTSEDDSGIGNCVLVDRDAEIWAGYHTIVARLHDPSIAEYLAALFQSDWWRNQLRRGANGVKVFSVTQRLLTNTTVLLPPEPERRRIVEKIREKVADFASAEAAIRKQITLLQELRTRLVSDAVTGAVEVE